MMKKQLILALALLVLIPVVMMAGGTLSNLINPEIAARTSNYVRNYQLLELVKRSIFFGALATAGLLWLLACVLVIRSKGRSYIWLLLAAFGPFGFAGLAMLGDGTRDSPDAYSRFLRRMNIWVRVAYEVCTFVAIWELAYQAMVVNREVIIRYQAITSGMSIQQIRDIQDASGGMWAFSEGLEIMFLVILFYALRPIVFCIGSGIVARFTATRAQS